MGRARAATDEQIFAAAEDLAAEIGWQRVVAGKVHERMGVGGSLSTFARAIHTWKAQKEAEAAEAGEDNTAVPEIVEHHASELDDLMAALNEGLADGLNRIRQVATAQVDRAIADERSKADTLRAADRAAHGEMVADLTAHNKSLAADNDELAKEALLEGVRADDAEEARDDLKLKLDALEGEKAALTSKVAELEKLLADAKSQAETAAQTAADRIEAADNRAMLAEQREAWLRKDVGRRDTTLETANSELSRVKAELATARAERQGVDGTLKATRKELQDAQDRADRAWERVERLEKRLPVLPDPLAEAVYMDSEVGLLPPDSE